MIKKSLAANARSLLKNKGNFNSANQSGSMILEAIIVLGMVATFTPLLYKHVADRRAEIENINRANTLLYLQQKTEEYLKKPENITALVTELGHNEHKEIFPSELGIGNNFDGRYIIGIRREDENNKPLLKAMIIDAVNTGSDLRAAKVAELIGVSAGIYTAVDPDAAWGINGLWSEPLSRYFTTTNFPTGAVAVTTEYNKEKYRVSISDILVDADLDLGEFELTAEQINAINIAAERGTIGELLATTEVASPKLVSSGSICFRKNGEENCIESWEGLGGQDSSDLMLVQMCNSGLTEMCMLAFAKDLNTSCSKVDAVYDRFGATYPSPKIYTLTYGTGGSYGGEVRVKCEGTQFIVDNISTSTLANTVEQVGDTAFGITTPGWYQITLMGEGGSWTNNGGYTWAAASAGGVLTSNRQFFGNEVLILKGIKGIISDNRVGGAGVALWDTMNTTSAPTLVAGGGQSGACGGGGYNGGYTTHSSGVVGYSWNEALGTNTTYCNSATCNIGATGGSFRWSGYYDAYGGTGYCGGGYTCATITGGNAMWNTSTIANYPASTHGNWGTNTLTGGKGYASIIYCGLSESDCSAPCNTNSDCPSDTPYCDNGTCTATKSCTASSDCTVASLPYCVSNVCSDTCTADSQCPTATPYCNSGVCEANKACSANSDCPSAKPYCNNNLCSAYAPYTAGKVIASVTNSTNNHSRAIASLGDNQCKAGQYSTNPIITLSTVTVPAGKYKIILKGESGYYDSSYSGHATAWGGIITAEKFVQDGTTFSLKSICGWYTGGPSTYGYWFWSGAGTGLWENGNVALVAGGGASGQSSGGGLIGGASRNANCPSKGYSADGVFGTSTANTNTDSSLWTAAYGGSPNPNDSMGFQSGTGGTGTSVAECRAKGYINCAVTTGKYRAGNSGKGSASITYCGPNSSSSCP